MAYWFFLNFMLKEFASLTGEATSPGPLGKERCTCPVHGKSGQDKGTAVSIVMLQNWLSYWLFFQLNEKQRPKNNQILKVFFVCLIVKLVSAVCVFCF